MTPKGKKAPLGQLLMEAGVIGEDQLARALERQRMQAGRLGRHLLDLGLAGESAIAEALSTQSGLPPFKSNIREVSREPSARLSPSMAKRWKVCPVEWDSRRGELTLAVADQPRLDVLDDIRFASGAKRVSLRIGPEAQIEALIARVYDGVEPPGEQPQAEASFMAGGFQFTSGQGGGKPREKTARKRGRAVVADADRKRARALGSLLEASGWEVVKAASPEEVARALGEGTRLWAHRDFPGADGFMTAIVYDDPAEALADALTVGTSLAGEACALARLAAEAKGGEAAALGSEAAGLLRLMGARKGLGQAVISSLEVKTWRAALDGFELPRFAEDYPGRELLGAASVYFRALFKGGTRHEAARAVREDDSLDRDAATLLLRWALGADLVGRMGRAGRVLAISPEKEPLASLVAHLARTGWEVEKTPDWEEGEWDCVVATLARGLNLLEGWSHEGRQSGRPPVFLLSEAASGPDTMYAIRLGAEDVFEPGVQAEVVEAKMQRAMRRAGADGQRTVTGNLRDMGLPDLMQVLSNGSRTCVLKIDGPTGIGTVALNEGVVTDARTPAKVGAAAFYEMVGWSEGRFEILPDAEPPGRSIEGESTEGLLMEGFRLLDESRR